MDHEPEKEKIEDSINNKETQNNQFNSNNPQKQSDNTSNENIDDIIKSIEHKDSNIKKKQNSQFKWLSFLMISLLLIIVVVPFFNQRFINTFDYYGLEFQKTKLGDITFYSTKFPVVAATGNVIGTYAINLRNDPREIDDIPINTARNNSIVFSLNRGVYNPVYISINPFMEMCDDSVISLATLSGYLKDSGLDITASYTDKAFARDNNGTHRWCDTAFLDTVIIVTDGNTTEINEIQDYCYEIKYNNCEIQKAVEKFMLVTLEDYTNRFQSEQ